MFSMPLSLLLQVIFCSAMPHRHRRSRRSGMVKNLQLAPSTAAAAATAASGPSTSLLHHQNNIMRLWMSEAKIKKGVHAGKLYMAIFHLVCVIVTGGLMDKIKTEEKERRERWQRLDPCKMERQQTTDISPTFILMSMQIAAKYHQGTKPSKRAGMVKKCCSVLLNPATIDQSVMDWLCVVDVAFWAVATLISVTLSSKSVPDVTPEVIELMHDLMTKEKDGPKDAWPRFLRSRFELFLCATVYHPELYNTFHGLTRPKQDDEESLSCEEIETLAQSCFLVSKGNQEKPKEIDKKACEIVDREQKEFETHNGEYDTEKVEEVFTGFLESLPPINKTCAVCNNKTGKLLRCKKCKKSYYCSETCQTADWDLHSGRCRQFLPHEKLGLT